jgi:hypothetical protein
MIFIGEGSGAVLASDATLGGVLFATCEAGLVGDASFCFGA